MSDRTDADRSAFSFEGQDAYDALSAALTDAVLILQPDGEVAFADPSLRSVLGIDPREIESRAFLDFVHPDDAVQDEPDGFWSVPPPFEREFRMRNASGQWVWVRALSPSTDRSGGRPATLDRVLGTRALVLVRDRRGSAPVRDADDLIHRAFDAVNNLVVVTDVRLPDNPLVVVNQNFVDTTGYRREEIVGKNCRFLQVRPDGTRDDEGDGQAEALETIREAVAGGTSAEVLLRNYRKDGTLFYNRLYLTPIHNPAGEVTHFVGVQNDVTTEVEQRDQADRQRRLLRAFFDSAPFLMGVVELEDGVVRHQTANDAAMALFSTAGVIGEVPEGAPLGALGLPEAEVATWTRHVEACATSGGPVHFQTIFPWGADAEAPGTHHLDVVVNTTAGTGPLFSYVAEDVTERRRADRELRLLVAAVEQAAEPIVVTDTRVNEPGPRILYANAAHARVFGYEVGEIIGQSPRLFQGPKSDRAVLDRVRTRLEAGEPVQAETVNYRKDGTEFVLQWEIAPVRDETGALTNWVGTQRDVTERRQLEREILEVAAREQENMAQDLHDGLGQVLTGAAFRLQALFHALEGLGQDELAADALRTRKLVEGALGQARAIARGLFPINIEPDGLAEALARLADDAAQAFEIDCSFEGDDVACPSREHAGHLYRIAQEALANAARHGRAKTIELSLMRRGPTATLSIRDDGVGISDTALAGGEGLGLRTMRYRADRVGGEFEVRPRVGGGTVVSVTFEPVDSAEEGE